MVGRTHHMTIHLYGRTRTTVRCASLGTHRLVFRLKGHLWASRVGWAICLVVPLVAASEAGDVRERASGSTTRDNQGEVGVRASWFGALASFLSAELPNDIVEIENFRGGRVECEDKVFIGGGECDELCSPLSRDRGIPHVI